MNEQDEALKQLLQRAAPGPTDRELKRDLWPEMRQRLDRPPVQIPWGDWALAATFLLCLLLFPETIPAVLLVEYANEASTRDVGLHSEQPEVAESLFNCRDLVWWAGILLGPCGGEAKLLFTARNPGALRHKAVLARNPFLDFLIGGAWTKRFALARRTRAPMSSFLVWTTHAGFEW